jgi:glycosyltransferase involved in cell wall biosynthesis
LHNLTVILIAGEEEHQIKRCLNSVRFASEIIVVCSSIKNKTMDIAKEFADRVYFKEWEGYARQKAYALTLASNEWVFFIDADEELGHDTIQIIRGLDENTKVNGYHFRRRNYFLGRWIKHCNWYPDFQPRLFKKSYTRVILRPVHESFEIQPPVEFLKADLAHYTHTDINMIIDKINIYSGLGAETKLQQKKISVLSSFVHGTSAFLNHLGARGGWKDGGYGLLVSFFHGLTIFLTYLKAWEIKRKTAQERGGEPVPLFRSWR